ncbi:DNA repair protein RadC [Indibacter alkaliphilus LW1]|jgi:DNA repair protein RadC|uniref:DNA repair protein RadC n=1 Tax=Indibacter alkaliphilus (strain CCUG 57479 / KCTC 22604 / LW1) TaxID=1189612 RepID=S2DDH6_INDAL|nr:DNA repair protein RadC [Indibacter alkaliphilus]EOZ97227.1 DNA repair protein RadC [Indibacter alkaliphilus LW1]
MEDYTSIKISLLSEEDRPREKLLLKGKSTLSDAELIAILIGSGTKQLSAVDLSKHILAKVNHSLADLAKLSITDLKKFKGIGEAKAISIVAALELGRRRKLVTEQTRKVKISSSADVWNIMKPDLMDESIEHFYILLLNRSNHVLKKQLISSGGTSGTVADPKIIFKHALDNMANSIILVHNHPSGNLKPSEQDRRLTNRLKEAGKNLEVPVLDHVIFTDLAYFSFADEGLI